jgi:hypothetical protein
MKLRVWNLVFTGPWIVSALLVGGLHAQDAMNTYTLAAIAQAEIEDQRAVFGGPFLRASAEMDADHNDWVTGGALLGFNRSTATPLTSPCPPSWPKTKGVCT